MPRLFYILLLFLNFSFPAFSQLNYMNESKAQKDKRMQWWREARFGMFIHWGLYSIPAGEWKGATNHAEWIRTTAQIPLKEYDLFLQQFNPVKFNAESWVQMAKDAGMKYITITTKHHDGFCLWDSKHTDFDVMNTPFKRDIIKELADACKKIGGIKLCFYHSIMDWHHPDYNERREWEKDRPVEGTDKKRYIAYMKAQLKELLTNYGEIGVLWFDGEWEGFWTHEDGVDLYNYVRGLQPSIIINNRVDKGRSGMAGMTSAGGYAGDFGTPEQEIPETGLPGVDWESCMTMNNNWGYNKADKNYKSSKELIQKLADITSKGGNFLLNIGPKADGSFPQESVDRLYDLGTWMKSNSSSIYGTTASPFEHINWGRVTQKREHDKTLLYLHIFGYPQNGEIKLEGMSNLPQRVYNLANNNEISFGGADNLTVVKVPALPWNNNNTVLVMEVTGIPLVYKAPVIKTYSTDFIQSTEATLSLPGDENRLQIRYTLDGMEPTYISPLYKDKIIINHDAVLKAKSFYNNFPVSAVTEKTFNKIKPVAAQLVQGTKPGLRISYYEGEWDSIPAFAGLIAKEQEVIPAVGPGKFKGREKYGLVLEGYIRLAKTDLYNFILSSDDGSMLYINDKLVVNNNGLHGMNEKNGMVALGTGYHKIRIEFFEKTGGDDLRLFVETKNTARKEVPVNWFYYK